MAHVQGLDHPGLGCPAGQSAILDETLPPEVTLFDIAVDPPALREEQRGLLD